MRLLTSVSIGAVHDNIVDAGILVLRLIPDIVAMAIRKAAILRIHTMRWQRVDVRSNCEPSRHASAIRRPVPPVVIVIAVTVVSSTGPMVIAAIAGPARKTIVDMSTAIASAGPVIIASTAWPVMKAVINLGTTAMCAA